MSAAGPNSLVPGWWYKPEIPLTERYCGVPGTRGFSWLRVMGVEVTQLPTYQTRDPLPQSDMDLDPTQKTWE